MTVPYVCSACCHRLVRPSVLSRKRQVVFASSHALESILSEAYQTPRPKQHGRYSGPSLKSEPPQVPPRDEKEDGPARASDDFATYISKAATRKPGRYSRSQQPIDVSLPPLSIGSSQQVPRPPESYTSELEELLRKGKLSQSWQFFSEHYTGSDCPALSRPSFRDVAKVRSRVVFAELLSQITATWRLNLQVRKKPGSPDLPSPVEVIKRFEKLGIATPDMYGDLAWKMSLALFGVSMQKAEKLDERHQTGLSQLMDLWTLCLEERPSNHFEEDDSSQDATASQWFFVRSDWLEQRRRHRQYFKQCFALFVPAARFDNTRRDKLATSALITHDLLTHGPLSDPDAPYVDFATSIQSLLRHSTLDLGSNLPKFIQSRSGDVQISSDAVSGLMARLAEHAPQVNTASAQKERPFPQEGDNGIQLIINRVGRAIERQDLDRVETLWTQSQAALHSEKANSSSNNAAINAYEQFLMAFFRLRRPQSALHVWNTMIQSGIDPTIRTWTVMMKGCHISRDVHIMESMWRRMRDTGIQPDVQAWSTRIHGLFKVGKMEEALRALDEMGREWAAVARSHRGRKSKAVREDESDLPISNINGVPKPNAVILNSALSALHRGYKQNVPRILAWSQAFDIDPDIITYNSLLNICLGQGQQEEAMDILKSMADAGVAPDSATYTILLNSMFHSSLLRDLNHAQQEEHVINFVVSLESNGVLVDEKGYGILVDRLLKDHDNLGAAKRVLAHMASREMEPTPHIYTILMTYYFDQNPPDLYAADALWNDIQGKSNDYGAALDVIFYDRMMEGYARHGDMGRTMAFLTRMSKEGKRPGWLAMAAVVKCLADKHEWDRLTQIVLDCHRQEGLLSVGMRGTKGQAEFWKLVSDLGVLDNLEIDV